MRKYRRFHPEADARPFVGVDGEGAGVDSDGRQHYRLLRVGGTRLWKSGRPLSTRACLGFLSDLPKKPIYVAFFFDYDATQILRDLDEERRARLFRERDPEIWNWVDWHGFQIDYMPRKYLRVRREGETAWTTINDTGSFFQCSFLQALERWQIGTPEERKLVEQGKKRRGGDELTPEDLTYNEIEVRLLADLMTAFREACWDIGYTPRRWQGPGALASAMMEEHGIEKRQTKEIPDRILELANDSFFGGRFEITHTGEIPGPVYGYDINSAYPFALLSLPCLKHGRWKKGRPGSGLWIGQLSFSKKDDRLCDLPVRSEKGVISWPRRGSGIYWSPEVEAAKKAGTRVRVSECWNYQKRCDCVPFSWVRQVYEQRKELGKDGKGLVLKLGLNSLYGKAAQSVGLAPYANPVWASLITSHTRALIIDAARRVGSRNVVMIATDGIFTRKPIPEIEPSKELGAWDLTIYDAGIFVIQPGLYFAGEKVRTRGIRRGFLAPREGAFRRAWERWRAGPPPKVPVPVRIFIGLKLAQARNDHKAAGRWMDCVKEIDFGWDSKRHGHERRRGYVVTGTKEGGNPSVPYRKVIGAWREAPMLARLEFQAMPDYVVPIE